MHGARTWPAAASGSQSACKAAWRPASAAASGSSSQASLRHWRTEWSSPPDSSTLPALAPTQARLLMKWLWPWSCACRCSSRGPVVSRQICAASSGQNSRPVSCCTVMSSGCMCCCCRLMQIYQGMWRRQGSREMASARTSNDCSAGPRLDAVIAAGGCQQQWVSGAPHDAAHQVRLHCQAGALVKGGRSAAGVPAALLRSTADARLALSAHQHARGRQHIVQP